MYTRYRDRSMSMRCKRVQHCRRHTMVCIRIRSNGHRYRDNEIPGTPTYPRSQEVSGLDMGVKKYHQQTIW